MSEPARAALVTGGARRIGRAIARALHQVGYAVAIHARQSQGDAQALCDELVRAGGRAAVVVADLADATATASLIGAASARGRPAAPARQ